MTDPQSAPGTGWTVQGSSYKVAPNVSGALTPGSEVMFTTQYGEPGTVFVPENQFTVANVQAAVAAKALIMDQVRTLKG